MTGAAGTADGDRDRRPASEVYRLEVRPPRGPRWLRAVGDAYATVAAALPTDALPLPSAGRLVLLRRDGTVALQTPAGDAVTERGRRHRLERDLAALTAAELEERYGIGR